MNDDTELDKHGKRRVFGVKPVMNCTVCGKETPLCQLRFTRIDENLTVCECRACKKMKVKPKPVAWEYKHAGFINPWNEVYRPGV